MSTRVPVPEYTMGDIDQMIDAELLTAKEAQENTTGAEAATNWQMWLIAGALILVMILLIGIAGGIEQGTIALPFLK